ncbi:uncharacterized protein LOC120782013, partial [Bactrocera tryoni]|uniref:uncharacterized protein LOC120782013 n=1 Tax=Bactrocera tryoni TaxID=59916 RepID=UPI001A973194
LTFSTSFFSGRCIVITSLLFAFVIYQFYSASIVGTLLMEKPKTIRTLRDLIHSSLAVGVEDIAYNRDYFLRTKDPIAIELYAKKVTSVPTDSETPSETTADNATALATLQPNVELTDAEKAKAYRDILHSHETGAHAKTNVASNWYDPEYGVKRIRRGTSISECQGEFIVYTYISTHFGLIFPHANSVFCYEPRHAATSIWCISE